MPSLHMLLTKLKNRQPLIQEMTALQTQAVCRSIFLDLTRQEVVEDGVPSTQADCRMRKEVIASSLSTSTITSPSTSPNTSSNTSSSSADRTKVADLALFARQSNRSCFILSGEDESESENDDEDGRALEAMVIAVEVTERSVTPSYLDFLMCDDSDASYYGTSGSSDDSGADDNDNYYDFDLDPAALVASMDPSSPYHHLNTGFSNDNEYEILQSLVEFGKTPRMFDDTPEANMSFFISPLAISQLARGLWTRTESACVIIHTRLPQRTSRFDDHPWSDDALRMLNLPNAGGSSLLSEVLSCEMLYRCLGARLAKTEMEIRYFFAYQPMTDYTISLPGLASGFHVGVSVTRAFAYKGAYRRSECRKLLKKKLSGITASTRNVMDERLFKQILHVWVPNGKVARTVQATYRTLPAELTRNSVVVISVVNAAWVFSNRR
ncbi:MAG: hypothetical protein J3R72DRAFT_458491 [Linnemannia gamsii]|nr:MAG: hypothetical protein J3R72DRAFT_458491 [Linnemannia gamsii]